MKPCRCVPPVPSPSVRAYLGTGGICLVNPGRSEAEALGNLRLHARKDRVARSQWVECWLERMDGTLLRMVPLEELSRA